MAKKARLLDRCGEEGKEVHPSPLASSLVNDVHGALFTKAILNVSAMADGDYYMHHESCRVLWERLSI